MLGAFFREIHRADELGSGMRKMMLYGKKYGGTDPQLIEGDVFRMIIRVPEFREKPDAPSEIAHVEAHEAQVNADLYINVLKKISVFGSNCESSWAQKIEW